MSGYTKGPWIVRSPKVQSVGTESEMTAMCIGDDNARLIAAAPDLLEALQELVFLYEHDEGCRELTEYKRAKAAIAKALGNN